MSWSKERKPKTVEAYLRLRNRAVILTPELFTDVCKRIKILERKAKKK